MSELFNRDFRVTLGTRLIRARGDDVEKARPTLRVTFKIDRSISGDPNKSEVAIYNLSQASRSAIQEKDIPTIIEGGYVNNLSQLFSGNLTFARHEREGTDWISTFEAGDGSLALQSSRINESFGPGTPIDDVINRVVECSGLGPGNVAEELSKGDFRGALTEFKKGFSASGKCLEVLKGLTDSAGLNMSVQDGQVQLLREGGTNGDDVVVLNASSGLIGSPEVGEDGIVSARSLLQGKLSPGRPVRIESALIDAGFFRIEKVTHIGDTHGEDWYSDIEARPL